MKIIFYDGKQYEIDSFEKSEKLSRYRSVYLEADLTGRRKILPRAVRACVPL